MEDLVSGKDKIQKICDSIKQQTIDPAKQEAETIIENAKKKAEEIIKSAEKTRDEMIKKAEAENKKKEALSLSSVQLAARQVIDSLKQEIEKGIFKSNLDDLISKSFTNTEVMARLIEVIISAIEKEGLDADISVVIAKNIGINDLNDILLKDTLNKLREKGVVEGNFSGGAKIVLHDKQITIDMSDEALTDLIFGYIGKSFRDMIFNAK